MNPKKLKKILWVLKEFALAVEFKENNFISPYVLFSGNHIVYEGNLITITLDNYQEMIHKTMEKITKRITGRDALTSLMIIVSSPYRIQFLSLIRGILTPQEIGNI